MKKGIITAAFILWVSSVICWAGDLETLCQKLPEGTFCFAATAGYDNFKDDFSSSTMGQIAADPQVKTFFEQLIASVTKAKDFPQIGNEGQDYVEFAKGLLRSPTVLAVSAVSDKMSDEPCVVLISTPIHSEDPLGKLFDRMIQTQMTSKKIIKKRANGFDIYVYNDPNACESNYIVSTRDCFLVALNDDNYTMLKKLADNTPNDRLADTLSSVPSPNEAMLVYVDFSKFIQLMQEEASTDSDAKQILEVLKTLGMTETRDYLIKCGFEGKNLVMDGKIAISVSGGVWDAIGPVDKSIFDLVDPKAMQATAMYIDPGQMYDNIMACITALAPADTNPVQAQIAQAEEMIGFKIREEFLAGIDGSFMGYMLPPYSSPELLTGGLVITARLKDAEKFAGCMSSLETLIKSVAPADQVQISSQKIADDKEVHIWAVGLMAMMQVIPSWAIEGDTLIFTSHPNVTKKMIQRIASPGQPSLMSSPDFANAAAQIPADAFMMSVTDSKAQARQFMKSLQQYWPMLNMGLMEQGIQLPIMLPSIEPYIEQMAPGLSYTRKTADGIEFHYEGTGLEATSGGAAGGAMGMAILMPALSKVKRVSEKVVCGTNLKGLTTAMVVYCNDYDDILPSGNWCDLLIEEADVSPKSFVCPESNAIEGESSYAMNKSIAGENFAALPPDVVLLFETDKGTEEGPRGVSIKTRRHYDFLKGSYDENTMVYKERFNQVGGPEDVVLHHNNSGKQGCNIAFADGHVEFVPQERIAQLRWSAE